MSFLYQFWKFINNSHMLLCFYYFSFALYCLFLGYVIFVVLFFFFKQKTAYDMRISDWSSDVCSSDLQVAEVAVEIRVQVVEEQPADAARLVAVLEEEVLVAPALVRLVAFLATERLAQRARGAVPVQHVIVERIERGQVEAAAEPPGHGLAVALRAEVAEDRKSTRLKLQSLMRISYAVFCLKKKK